MRDGEGAIKRCDLWGALLDTPSLQPLWRALLSSAGPAACGTDVAWVLAEGMALSINVGGAFSPGAAAACCVCVCPGVATVACPKIYAAACHTAAQLVVWQVADGSAAGPFPSMQDLAHEQIQSGRPLSLEEMAPFEAPLVVLGMNPLSAR